MGTPCHFALFDLQPGFNLDLDQLAVRYRELARGVHPDRFADASEREQRLALEQSAGLNEAYQTLKNPSKRARYLLALKGNETPLEVTVHDPEFLMQQMQWREALDEARGAGEVEALEAEVREAERRMLAELAARLDERHDAAAAAEQVRALMFVQRFGRDIERRLEQLEEAS